MKCEACGAVLGPSQPTCSFCGAITPFGVHQQHLQQQHAAHAHAFQLQREHQEGEQKRAEAQREVKRAADASLYWGIGGLLFCCAFIPSVMAIVFGLRARKLARRRDLVIPTNSTLGLAFGAVGVLAGAGIITIGIVENVKRDAEIESIDAKLEGKLEQAALTQPTACLLAKRSLLKGEFKDSNSAPDTFDCDGKLTVTGEKAVLEDLRFKRSSTQERVRVCFEHGARWRVTGFRQDASCDQAEDIVESTDTGRGASTSPVGSRSPGVRGVPSASVTAP
jgi:hypothetical protein